MRGKKTCEKGSCGSTGLGSAKNHELKGGAASATRRGPYLSPILANRSPHWHCRTDLTFGTYHLHCTYISAPPESFCLRHDRTPFSWTLFLDPPLSTHLTQSFSGSSDPEADTGTLIFEGPPQSSAGSPNRCPLKLPTSQSATIVTHRRSLTPTPGRDKPVNYPCSVGKMATASSPPSAPPYEFRQAPPQHAQPQFPSAQQKPAPSRKSRTFSFRSDKSRSSGSHKVDLRETPAEKEAKKLRTKADPTVAMQEAEPCKWTHFKALLLRATANSSQLRSPRR